MSKPLKAVIGKLGRGPDHHRRQGQRCEAGTLLAVHESFAVDEMSPKGLASPSSRLCGSIFDKGLINHSLTRCTRRWLAAFSVARIRAGRR